MGSTFCVVHVPKPPDRTHTRQALHEWAHAAPSSELFHYLDILEFEGYETCSEGLELLELDEIDDSDPRVRDGICKLIDNDIHYLFEPTREVAFVTLDIPYAVTGGMSWGDTPNDAYEPLIRLAEASHILRELIDV